MYTLIAEHCIAFEGHHCISKGTALHVAEAVKQHIDTHPDASILIFDAETSRIVEMDVRGTTSEVRERIAERLQH